jgi:hypothetical protein
VVGVAGTATVSADPRADSVSQFLVLAVARFPGPVGRGTVPVDRFLKSSLIFKGQTEVQLGLRFAVPVADLTARCDSLPVSSYRVLQAALLP